MASMGDRTFTALQSNEEGLKKYQKPENIHTDIFVNPSTGRSREGSELVDAGVDDSIHRMQMRHRSGSVTEFHLHTDTGKSGGVYHTTRDGNEVRARWPKKDPKSTPLAQLQDSLFRSK